ncbi:valine--tRNA ligase [bacterium]|nr:valine--tRNA ligase [bacterium]
MESNNVKNLPKAYSPKEVEEKIYKLWQKSGFFTPKIDHKKKPFVISIPPPNITGSLHMGHALNNTIQDILVRYHRMKGDVTLWVPGTDHAGIATQNVVEKELKKEGLTRYDLGREKFIKRVWQWKEKYGSRIIDQLKKLGCSCDWTRLRFTLDESYSKAVRTAFVHYYNKGYIYKGPRIVNWCPRCHTAISDIEIKYKPQITKLYTFKYSKEFPISIATTRPETKLGDTAIAVNPKDKRYKKYIGQEIKTNFLGVNLKIKIISDRNVDPDFGTGALGVTPAHSMVDFEMAQANDLEIINVIGPEGKMTDKAGPYKGMRVNQAREKIVQDLKKQGLLEKVEDYEHSLSLCDRCGTPIEPLISEQWFVKMKELAQPAIEVVKKNKIKFIPKRYKKIYLNWMENLKDWCISRQLWWGHQFPVFYCSKKLEESKNKKAKLKINEKYFVVSEEKPKKCPFCGKCDMVQETDVLDTWFSSALWPFATLGWPEQTDDLKYFYPTTFLCTAPEILYLWVARMIFSSLEFMKTIPFKTVYLHSTVLTKEGRRMSKSLGTGVDPLELIDKYGADATRFGIIYQTTRDLQAIHFGEEALLASQKFINKLWNIGRFILTQDPISPCQRGRCPKGRGGGSNTQNLTLQVITRRVTKPNTLTDKWILSRLNNVIKETTNLIEKYELGKAEHLIYEFIWHEFADWYVEISKKEKNIPLTKEIYLTLLKLLHPFIPFSTEKIYSYFNKQKQQLLIFANWPLIKENLIDKKSEKDFKIIQNFIIKLRNIKKENKINPSQIISVYILKKESKYFNLIQKQRKIIEHLSKTKLKFVDKKPKGVKLNFKNIEVFIITNN